MKQANATEMVEIAINSRKIRPDQKQWAMDYATRDPKGFEVFVSKTIAMPEFANPSSRIDNNETQQLINTMCGVDDETWEKYGPNGASNADQSTSPDETQRLINMLFEKDDTEILDAAGQPIDETQRLINKLMGVDATPFRKYGTR